jgi:hypothetical protein
MWSNQDSNETKSLYIFLCCIDFNWIQKKKVRQWMTLSLSEISIFLLPFSLSHQHWHSRGRYQHHSFHLMLHRKVEPIHFGLQPSTTTSSIFLLSRSFLFLSVFSPFFHVQWGQHEGGFPQFSSFSFFLCHIFYFPPSSLHFSHFQSSILCASFHFSLEPLVSIFYFSGSGQGSEECSFTVQLKFCYFGCQKNVCIFLNQES